MKKVYMLLFAVLAVTLCSLIILSCENIPADAPVPGNSGTIMISKCKATSLTLIWWKSEDETTAQQDLEYCAYYATVSSIETPEDVEANAIPAGGWEKDITTRDITGLDASTDYYLTVLVRDKDGNMAVYEVVEVLVVSVNFNNRNPGADSYELTVSDTDIEEININIQTDSNPVTVRVPSGLSRLFTAAVHTASASSHGEKRVNLELGGDASVTIDLELYETKIIVPDAMNNRIVQIDDMQGNGWLELDYDDFGLTITEFNPYDIDFDSLGRIYIANNYTSDPSTPQVLRFDDFNDSTSDIIIKGMTKGVVSLAIDRENDIVYYSTDSGSGNNIHRCDYNGNNNSIFVSGSYGFYGLAVDENGDVYAVDDESDFIFLNKYDTNGTLVDGAVEYSYLNNPLDVLVRDPYLYLIDNFKILRLDPSDLIKDPSSQFGKPDDGSPPENPEEFYGPRQFMAIINDKFTIIDEEDFVSKNRLVSFDDDPLGNDWETYGSTGSGQHQFSFYLMY
jgi:hypothetical protein